MFKLQVMNWSSFLTWFIWISAKRSIQLSSKKNEAWFFALLGLRTYSGFRFSVCCCYSFTIFTTCTVMPSSNFKGTFSKSVAPFITKAHWTRWRRMCKNWTCQHDVVLILAAICILFSTVPKNVAPFITKAHWTWCKRMCNNWTCKYDVVLKLAAICILFSAVSKNHGHLIEDWINAITGLTKVRLIEID
jgi:hypothetical protein